VKVEEERKSITLTKNLEEQVRGRVQTYEEIAFGTRVVVVRPAEIARSSEPNLEESDHDTMRSIELRSESQLSENE
jgi:hypothetical protein